MQGSAPAQNVSRSSYQEREPPPYPGNSFQGWFEPGLRQSYSGSEASTDFSLSSTESLSTRQEPQGQETASLVSTPIDNIEGNHPFPEHLLSQFPTSGFDKSLKNNTLQVSSNMGGGGLSSTSLGTELEVPTEPRGRGSRGSSPKGKAHTPPPYQQAIRSTSQGGVIQQAPPSITTNVKATEALSATQVPSSQMQVVVAPKQSRTQGNHSLHVPNISPNISPQGSFKSSPVGSLHDQQQQNFFNLGHDELQQLILSQQNEEQNAGRGLSRTRSEVTRENIAFIRSQSNSMRSTKSASPTPQRPETPVSTRSTSRPSTAPARRSAQPPPFNQEYHNIVPMRPNSLPYGQTESKNLRRSYEMLDRLPQTHSQPDLSRLAATQETSLMPLVSSQHFVNNEMMTAVSPQPMQILQQQQQHQMIIQRQQQQQQQQQQQHSVKQGKKKLPELDHAAIATRATQMVERLSQENLALRKELHSYYNKVCKLQKFESEIEKIHDAYESLVKHSQKREALEKAMRCKLESTINSLKHTNQQLKDQLDKAVQQISNGVQYEEKLSGNEIKRELQRKNSLLNKVIAQNHDILRAKERLQIEVANQRSTLHEQRAQIALLDNALSYAQSNVMKFQEQQRNQLDEEDRASNLQKAFELLQKVTSDHGQGVEQEIYAKLQEELQSLKMQQSRACRSCDTDEGISSDSESPTSVQSLIQHLQEKEQRIALLEAQVIRWEQKYLEEQTWRQLAADVASLPNRDAGIAALEENSITTERIMADAKAEKLRHLEEVYQANRHLAEAEAKICSLQAQLAKKDAMIQVLKRHPASPYSCNPANMASLLSSPMHSPHPSLLSPSPVRSLSPMSFSPIPSTPFTAFSTPGSGASSRQNSHIDSNSLPTLNSNSNNNCQDAKHNKSNSTGSAGQSHESSAVSAAHNPHFNPSTSTNSTNHRGAQWKELQQKMAAQAALFGTLQSGSEQLKKCFWQV